MICISLYIVSNESISPTIGIGLIVCKCEIPAFEKSVNIGMKQHPVLHYKFDDNYSRTIWPVDVKFCYWSNSLKSHLALPLSLFTC